MQQSSCYWSIERANLYLLSQLPKAKIDGSNIQPIISKDSLVGGPLSSRGVVFEVIQSLWFTLSACVGTGSWSKESPGGSASPYVDWERNAAKKIAPQSEETTTGNDFLEINLRNDCATRTNATRLPNANQLASLKT